MRSVRDLPVEIAWELALSDGRGCGTIGGRPANLVGVDLSGVDLSHIDLHYTDLCQVNLESADLTGCYLGRAVLRGTNLRNAVLEDTYLNEADFRGAILDGTCLDPSNVPSGADESWERTKDGLVVGYRTRISTHCGNTYYDVGKTYTAPFFSTSETGCHPGLYLWPTYTQAVHFVFIWVYGEEIIKVHSRPENIHKAGNKWRTKTFTVVESVGFTCG